MALELADKWVWDCWFATEPGLTHLFYLQAPKSLGDPDLRHRHATVGHAVSEDLRTWKVVDDALGPGPTGSWDDLAVWTGSVVAHEGGWTMFYTGACIREDGLVQRIGAATSIDLHTWTRVDGNPLIQADERWYERLDLDRWHDEAWRDPWVFADPGDNGYHALITARVAHAAPWAAGVIGHAWSPDLKAWEVRPPLVSQSGFGQLEVPQIVEVEGGVHLLFSYDETTLPRNPNGTRRPSSTYIAPATSHLGPFDLDRARPIGTVDTYSGRAVPDAHGRLHLLAFANAGPDGFIGAIPDPIPLDQAARGG